RTCLSSDLAVGAADTFFYQGPVPGVFNQSVETGRLRSDQTFPLRPNLRALTLQGPAPSSGKALGDRAPPKRWQAQARFSAPGRLADVDRPRTRRPDLGRAGAWQYRDAGCAHRPRLRHEGHRLEPEYDRRNCRSGRGDTGRQRGALP